jgi:hypothetical protein
MGLMAKESKQKLCKDVWVTMSSARNGLNELIAFSGAWIADRIHYEDWDIHPEALLKYYQVLGFGPAMIQNFIHAQIRFQNGKLKVASHLQHGNGASRVHKLIMYSWKFKDFNKGRWLTIGYSSRTMMRAICFGLHDIVQYIEDHGGSMWFLKGIKNYSSHDVNVFIAMGAASSDISDEAMRITESDDRLPVVVHDIIAAMQSKGKVTSSIPYKTWAVIAEAIDVTPELLIEKTMQASLASGAYIMYKLQPALEDIYPLLVGNIEDNVNDAMLQKEPTQQWSTSWKVWTLLKSGYNRHEVIDALKLLSRCCWSTNMTEQGHASASVITKLHKRIYSATTIQDRSVVYAANALVCDSKEEKEVMKLERQTNKLAKRQPSKITGRHMYVRHLHAGHKRKRYKVGSRSSKVSRWNACKVIIRKHRAS